MEDIYNQPSIEEAPGVRGIHSGRPLAWLAQGVRDLARAPAPSLFYGVVFAAAGYLAIGVLGQFAYLVTAMLSGFLLLAPFLAIGLYRISQRLERGERPGLIDSMTAWRVNYGSIGLFAAFLGFAFIFWERLSAIMFALFHGRDIPAVDDPSGWIFLLGEDPAFFALYGLVGAVAAAVVFAASVVTIPLMLDRPIDPVTALITSLRSVGKNSFSLFLWALLIAVLFVVGVLSWFIGLVLIMPVLGHASWHAYRDLVEPGPGT